jgi:nitrite reductase/ring-hydroxylating ferredoxin subunit/Fe-S cluster biogenesis protein NfuA
MNAPEPTRRADLGGLLGDIESLERIFAGWGADERGATEAYRRAIEALHGEALRRLIRALKMDPAALGAMKSAAGDEVVYAVLRHHGLLKPSLNERIAAALQGIRPFLTAHGGDVEIVKIEPPRLEVRFSGACDGCAASALTFQAGVRKAVQEKCPEISEIVELKGKAQSRAHFISPFGASPVGQWRSVCRLSDIADGALHKASVAARPIVLFRCGNALTCFDNACAHLGHAIDAGTISNGIITCPHHGFRYDLADGRCLTAPDVQLRAHAVRVVGDVIELRLTA